MLKTDNNYFVYENIGEFHSNDEWIHPVRVIDSYELIFVLSGTVYLFEEGKRYEGQSPAFVCQFLEYRHDAGPQQGSGADGILQKLNRSV